MAEEEGRTVKERRSKFTLNTFTHLYMHNTRSPATHSLVWTQWVASVDLFANEDAHANIVVTPTDSWTQQGEEVFPSYK